MGWQVQYLYSDKTGRLEGCFLSKDPNDLSGGTVRFSYDKQGNLAGYDDGVTKAHYDYDQLGRRIKESVNYGTFTTGHSYTFGLEGPRFLCYCLPKKESRLLGLG